MMAFEASRSSQRDAQCAAPLNWRFTLNSHHTPPPSFDSDESLARSMTIGQISHVVIGTMLRNGRSLDLNLLDTTVNEATHHFAPIERRAHRMRVSGAVVAYFRHCLPPPLWLFFGAELHLGRGRVDLLWTDFRDRVLLDELKTGHAPLLNSQENREQIDKYVTGGSERWGSRLVGVRVLAPLSPHRSIFVAPGSDPVPLIDTEHVAAVVS